MSFRGVFCREIRPGFRLQAIVWVDFSAFGYEMTCFCKYQQNLEIGDYPTGPPIPKTIFGLKKARFHWEESGFAQIFAAIIAAKSSSQGAVRNVDRLNLSQE